MVSLTRQAVMKKLAEHGIILDVPLDSNPADSVDNVFGIKDPPPYRRGMRKKNRAALNRAAKLGASLFMELFRPWLNSIFGSQALHQFHMARMHLIELLHQVRATSHCRGLIERLVFAARNHRLVVLDGCL